MNTFEVYEYLLHWNWTITSPWEGGNSRTDGREETIDRVEDVEDVKELSQLLE